MLEARPVCGGSRPSWAGALTWERSRTTWNGAQLTTKAQGWASQGWARGVGRSGLRKPEAEPQSLVTSRPVHISDRINGERTNE